MTEVVYTDEVSRINKNISIASIFPFDAKKDPVFRFFVDDENIKNMFQTLSLKAMTTKDIQLVETQIQTGELKQALKEYIQKIQIAEHAIIYFLEQKGYINRLGVNHTAHMVFTSETIEYMPKDFVENMQAYLFGKGYFKKEFEKLDDENGLYKLVIEVKYEENDSYIENITIEKI